MFARACVVAVFLFSFVSVLPARAGIIRVLPAFTKNDRVLVLAPHPDDESIGAGGVIQKALKAGAQVKIVLMTNGENNELSFLVFKKRPVLSARELIKMGEVRHQESVVAMMSLGLSQGDIIPLGYPDFGTMDIMTKYWGKGIKKPFRSMLSRQRKVPYANARSFGAPYVGESILGDLKGVIEEFRPTKIFVSHPVDVNRDHRALYLFMKVALWDLEGQISDPVVFPYLIHVVGWPKPRGYAPEKILYVPEDLLNGDISWDTVTLDNEVIQKKHEAIKFYVSQNKYAPTYLATFVRRNELFGDFPPVPVVRQMNSEVVWQQVSAGAAPRPSIKARQSEQIAGLAYARQGNNILIRLRLKRAIDREMGVSIFLLGYRKDIPFGDMPKINLVVGIDGFHVKDRRRNISSRDIQYTVKDKDLIFSVPLSVIGSPERILSCARTAFYDLPFDETAWRELVIK